MAASASSRPASRRLSLTDVFRTIGTYRSALIAGNLVAILATLVSVPTPLLIPVLVDEVLLKKSDTLTRWIDTVTCPKIAIFNEIGTDSSNKAK